MTLPTVSVIVVSLGRPGLLHLCLRGISQLRYPAFEIVVVADRAGVEAVQAMDIADRLKVERFDTANISDARNIGLRAAAGEIVAFIDDDAVPEPTWLDFLAAPFADPEVAACGGFVRGRNGISWQWKARSVDGLGNHSPLDLPEDSPTRLTPTRGQAVRTEGTNMAFRRNRLAAIGGFDPAFRFFLDETDVNMRMARQGLSTAIAPRAEVHHGYAAGPYRRADRVPVSLFEMGASLAVFWRKYASGKDAAQAWETVQDTERRRLVELMVCGSLEPRDVRRLMASLRAGFAEGERRDIAPLSALGGGDNPFLLFPPADSQSAETTVLSGWTWQRRALRQEAARLSREGYGVSLFLFSPTALYHRMRYRPGGYWEQSGGLFGRSLRDQPLVRVRSFAKRVQDEQSRVARQRGIPATTGH